MRIANIILVYIILILNSISLAQSFVGTVLDKRTKEPVPYADVYFVDLSTGTTTDDNGIFTVGHFNQKYLHIQISYVGYKKIDEIINIDSTKEKTFFLEQSHINLDEIIVTSVAGRLQGENIVNVDHKKLMELKQNSPLTLSEAISNISGVEQITTGAGIGKPVIRGLSGNRIVTYAQGIRIENQQWGDEHGLGVGEVGIESIEVIKGPASLLYGSDALGGVLYFTDERFANHNTMEGYAQSKFLSNTLGSINNIGVKIHKEAVKLNLFGTYSSHADYSVPDNQRVFNTRFEEKNIKSSLGFNSDNWVTNIRYSYLQNKFGIVEDANFSDDTQREFILPYQKIDNHNLSLENILFSGDSRVNLTLGYTFNHRKEFEDDMNTPALDLKLKTFSYNLRWYSPSQNKRFDYILGTQGMIQSNLAGGEELLIPNASVNDIGVFFIGNYNSENLQFQGGIRTDYRNIDSEEMGNESVNFSALKKSYFGFTFSAGALYKYDRIKLRANISTGFRSPNTSELLSNGIHPGDNSFVKGDINLVNENATQIDFSFQYMDEHFRFAINPFYNSIRNYIYLSPMEKKINNLPAFEYLQTTANLYGGEFGFHYHPHFAHWIHFEGNLSTVVAEDKNGLPLPLIPQTKISSILRAEISNLGKVRLQNVFVQYIYKFKQNRTGLFETVSDSYDIFNVGFNLLIESKTNPIEINAGINNLLNNKYIDHLSRLKSLGVPNPGINYYIDLKIKFRGELN